MDLTDITDGIDGIISTVFPGYTGNSIKCSLASLIKVKFLKVTNYLKLSITSTFILKKIVEYFNIPIMDIVKMHAFLFLTISYFIKVLIAHH